ncbi:MAG TPA: hypothetical protein VFQ47_02990 [Nitrososphaera sp.]|nr:hypothetical protein [Nitrososphaera sp.]
MDNDSVSKTAIWNDQVVVLPPDEAPFTDVQFAFYCDVLEQISSLPPEKYYSQTAIEISVSVKNWMANYWNAMEVVG